MNHSVMYTTKLDSQLLYSLQLLVSRKGVCFQRGDRYRKHIGMTGGISPAKLMINNSEALPPRSAQLFANLLTHL